MKKVRASTDSLLPRDAFRAAVFARDQHRCVCCGEPAQDAHHILERRLFDDGGYYLSNGASLCGPCHLRAEQTLITVEQLRERAGITAPALPAHLYPDECYDKWGNIVLPTGRRTKGELFHDESVQKVLRDGGVLPAFTDHVKYPRTLHVPWSPGATADDRILQDLSAFVGEEVIVTAKMDGENTTLYRDYYHARSLDSSSHPSQSWARKFHSEMAWNIEPGWRICAENLYAQHSIAYRHLPSYLLAFSIWDASNRCLAWDHFVEWTQLLGMHHVPVLYRGPWDEEKIRTLHRAELHGDPCEGYVVRVARAFTFAEFRRVVAKYVRANHVQTAAHWKHRAVQPNLLAQPPGPETA